MTTITRWDGKTIHGVSSTGSGVFAAYDWKDMVFGAVAGPIEQKAACGSKQARAFSDEDLHDLRRLYGRYSDVQSVNSEDTVTWSVFAGSERAKWLSALIDEAFGHQACCREWSLQFWQRTPHPDTGESASGPEADVLVSAQDHFYVVEAKWTSDLGKAQGAARDKTQLEMRHGQAIGSECRNTGVLVIAPRPAVYSHAHVERSVFRRYFVPDGNGYARTAAAEHLKAVCVTWERIAELMDLCGEGDRAAYLRWRLALIEDTWGAKGRATC